MTLPSIEATAGSDNWYAARRGFLTASRMADAMSFLKNGSPSKDRINYMMDLVAERMSGVAATHYVTDAMQWGIDNEAGAIAEFENETGLIVRPAGFVVHPSIPFFGASPDGFLIYADAFATLEIKCPTTRTFVEWTIARKVPDAHRLQMLAQMACCGTREGVFVAFDPRIVHGRKLMVVDVTATNEEILEVEEAAKTFLRQTEEIFEKVTENA